MQGRFTPTLFNNREGCLNVQLQLLWELQELDLSIKELQSKIEEAPGLSGVQEAKEYLENLENEYTEKSNSLQSDRKQLKQMELEVQSIVEHSNELKDSMYGGKVTNVKELEQMQRKVDLLADDKAKLEEKMISLMESIESLEEELRGLEEKISKAKEDLEQRERKLEEELAKHNRELEELQARRDDLAKKIEKKYLEKYQFLAEKKQGKALARVADDICGGCRVFISSAQRGHLYNPSAMVYCENCGRLLVKLD